MKGTNTLKLNNATVRAAVEEYMNSRALPRGEVVVTGAKVAGNEFTEASFTVVPKDDGADETPTASQS